MSYMSELDLELREHAEKNIFYTSVPVDLIDSIKRDILELQEKVRLLEERLEYNELAELGGRD